METDAVAEKETQQISAPVDSTPSLHAPLMGLINEILAADRFGDHRQDIVKQHLETIWELELTTGIASRTIGYSGHGGEDYRTGRTLTGTMACSKVELNLHTRYQNNEVVDQLRYGDKYRTRVRATSWNALYDRLIVEEAPD